MYQSNDKCSFMFDSPTRQGQSISTKKSINRKHYRRFISSFSSQRLKLLIAKEMSKSIKKNIQMSTAERQLKWSAES